VLGELNFSQIKKGQLYFLPSASVVRVVRVDRFNQVFLLRNYLSHTNESIDFDSAPKVLKRAFTISDVSRVVRRKVSTIRKYENDGLLASPRKILLKENGVQHCRVYSDRDVEDVIEFFRRRKPVGRPALRGIMMRTEKPLRSQDLRNR